MGLFGAARSSNRMAARQQYRTMSRMQRRRSYFQQSTGMHQDFAPAEEESAPAEETSPSVNDQIQELADLKNKGVITEEEFKAKKKQLLGI